MNVVTAFSSEPFAIKASWKTTKGFFFLISAHHIDERLRYTYHTLLMSIYGREVEESVAEVV